MDDVKLTNRDFDWHASINPVLIIEINAVDLKSLEAGFAGSPDIGGIALDLPGTIELDPKFGSQLHFVPHPPFQSLAEKDFVGFGAVDIGGVEEGDTGVDGVVDELDHVRFRFGNTVQIGHAHAS
ncbi:hypothetical protein HanPI659440_Chr06g0233561 [Helianthus annuus]|nr:hypothetical protein HanPI659440_Chr06g0233561 [Helianthus annuus]